MQEVRKKLFELQDKSYQQFQSGLCPKVDNIIGVRLPELRKIAKQIAKENAQEYLEKAPKEYHEEKMLQGFVIGYMQAEFSERLFYLNQFVPMIDNWAICDCCCSTYKFTQKHLSEMWEYLQKYLKSEKEFELRFVVVMFMDYFLLEEYIDRVLQIYDNIQHEGYYVKMGIAWAISMAYIKFPEKTMKLLEKNHLDNFTYNKALQKIIESYRVDQETKQKMKMMKRK